MVYGLLYLIQGCAKPMCYSTIPVISGYFVTAIMVGDHSVRRGHSPFYTTRPIIVIMGHQPSVSLRVILSWAKNSVESRQISWIASKLPPFLGAIRKQTL